MSLMLLQIYIISYHFMSSNPNQFPRVNFIAGSLEYIEPSIIKVQGKLAGIIDPAALQ